MPVTLEDDVAGVDALAEELVAIGDALERLAVDHPRPARVVECRYFAGMSVRETADALGLAPRTVNRDKALAQAWLRRELSAAGEASASLAERTR